MPYYSAIEMKTLLDAHPQMQEYLYVRGFLLTDHQIDGLDEYPFYGNWIEQRIDCGHCVYYFYINSKNYLHVVKDEEYTHFIIGHAYNPYAMQYEEDIILRELANAQRNNAYWDKESELTGVFYVGYFNKTGNLVSSTDCCGMQNVYYGQINGKLFVSSHSKLVADLNNLQRDPYVERLVNSRFYKYWGRKLPGDISSFSEVKRLQPNCSLTFYYHDSTIDVCRYYPKSAIEEVRDSQSFQSIIHECGRIMHNTMELIAKKWPNGQAAISVTGGQDSLTALACSNGLYDQYRHFSYISNDDEAVDAYAAEKICAHLGIDHTIHRIPVEDPDYKDIDIFAQVLECNSGCCGRNNQNDIRKRLYFAKHPPCDMEVKSWVNEMGRGWYWNKYNKKKFPQYPTAAYFRAMHKVYVDPKLIRDTDKIFQAYIDKYYGKEIWDKICWLELYFWEFSWCSGEGLALTGEHRVSYDITIPFNNRKYVELMLTVPLSIRVREGIPNALIDYMEPRIRETGISVHDVSHTNFRAFVVRMYLDVFSKIRFS